MALPIIADCLRCAFKWTHSASSQYAVNVMHFSGDASSMDACATALAANVTPSQFGQITDSAAVTELTITPLDGSSVSRSYDLSASWKGAAASTDQWVPNTALVLTLRTGFRGRSNRGRVYLPFVDEGAVENGQLLAAAGLIAGPWNDFKDAMNADAHPWEVASYLNATMNFVTQVAVNQAAGTQRRRQSRLR